jgi:putative transposase
MKNCVKFHVGNQEGFLSGDDALTEALRRDVRAKVELILSEEIDAALGAGSYERTASRIGYRQGVHPREISTPLGKEMVGAPRGRYFEKHGENHEYHSTMLPRYARRAKSVNAALIGMYLGGVNTRRVKAVLRPLLRGTPLSKSAVSRLVQRLKEAFETWRQRPLDGRRFVVMYMDAIYLKARFAGKVSSVPVLAVVGVTAKGEKVLVSLEAKGAESQEAWRSLMEGLVERGLKVSPKLVIIDGNAGLRAAVAMTWPKADVQRCTVHKLRNLLSHAPEHTHEAIREGFHRIVYATSLGEAKAAYEQMLKLWRKQGEAVARSLEEAGEELLTFFKYPESQWKALRTTNAIERLNLEFRRRIKTQSSFPTAEAALLLLFGLVVSGQVKMRRIDGWKELPNVETFLPASLVEKQEIVKEENRELITAA